VEVYRAKQVKQPRPESIRLEGQRLNAAELLTDLRTHVGMDTVLGLPPGPNSGLSVKLLEVGSPAIPLAPGRNAERAPLLAP